MHFIPYGKQWIDKDDIKAVNNVLNSDFLTQGPMVSKFEKNICQYTNAKYCVVVSNGTAALHLAVKSLELPLECEGITSPNTFVASSNAMIYNEIKPIFVDIDRKTYNIDVDIIEQKLTEKTKLIIPVHFAGQTCDIVKLNKIAKNNECYIIEDAAHAIGSEYSDGAKVGSCKFSDMTIFSFHPVKTMTTGEGGAITTNDSKLYNKLLLLRSHGITKDPAKLNNNHGMWYYEMQKLGYNYRITDIQAAIGITQLSKINKFIEKRKKIVNEYNRAFEDIEWLITPYEKYIGKSAFHLYVLLIDFNKINKTKNQVMNELRERNIGTQVHYIPVHIQPYYKEKYNYKLGDYPVAEEYYKKALSIPLYPKMSDDDVEYVISCIKSLYK